MLNPKEKYCYGKSNWIMKLVGNVILYNDPRTIYSWGINNQYTIWSWWLNTDYFCMPCCIHLHANEVKQNSFHLLFYLHFLDEKIPEQTFSFVVIVSIQEHLVYKISGSICHRVVAMQFSLFQMKHTIFFWARNWLQAELFQSSCF